MAALNEVTVKIKPELDPELRALLGTATDDTLAKINAGAALVHAIYHTPKEDVPTFFVAMPESVAKAYMQACEAYGIGSNNPTDRFKWVEVANQTDAVKVIDDDADTGTS